jgi:cobalt-zinc-cadmium efflux system outer membrane protein
MGPFLLLLAPSVTSRSTTHASTSCRGQSRAPAAALIAAFLLTYAPAGVPGQGEIAPAFPQLLQQAQGAPRLLVARAGVATAQGEALQAAARPNPSVGLQIENVGGQRIYRGFDRAESTLAVHQPVELPGKRAARIEAALGQVTAAEARALQARAEFGHELAVAYGTAEAAIARSGIAAESLTLAEDDAARARQLVINGREAEVRALQARTVVSAARADLDLARADAQTALGRLSVLSAAPQPFTSVVGGLLNVPFVPAERTAESFEVLAARAEFDAANRRIEAERRRATPDVTLTLGVRRFQETGTTALVAGAALPIPVFDRNQGAVAVAAAQASAAEARLALASAEARAARQSALTQFFAATSRLGAAGEGEAAAGEAYRLARVGYEAGRLPLLEVLNARRALIDARSRTVDSRISRLRAAADLARAEGITLGGGAL